MRGPHNIWRLIQTGATFERSGAMTIAMDAMDAPKSIRIPVRFLIWPLKFIGLKCILSKKKKTIKVLNKLTRSNKNIIAPYKLVKTMRASILVMGPLLAKYGRSDEVDLIFKSYSNFLRRLGS